MATVSEDASPPRGQIRRGFRIQSRVIGALIMRELHTRYGRENIGYLWLILEPMMLASMVALIHSRAPNHFGSDMKPVPFALVGYCNFMTFRSIANRAEGTIEANISLLFHRTISIFDLLLARAMLEAAGTLLAFTVLMGLAIAFGMALPPERPLIYMVGLIEMVWLSFGISMIVCSLTHNNRAAGRIVHPITYIMMPLSGAFFVIDVLPPQLRSILLKIPLAHIFETIRYGWFKSASPKYIDEAYLLAWILGTTLIGLLLISVTRRRIQLA